MNTQRHATLSGYLAILNRRKWWVAVAIVATTASAVFFAAHQTKQYSASAQVLLNPDTSLVNGAGQSAADAQARFDSGQAVIAHTPAVATRAVSLAGGPSGVTANSLLNDSTVSSDPSSNVLTFTVTSGDRAAAKDLVNGYVDAYSSYSADGETQNIRTAIATLNRQLTDLERRVKQTKASGSSAAALYAELKGVINQRTHDQEALNSVQASGGATVARRASGASQTRPTPGKDAALGVVLGIVLGIALAFVREALDTRVRSADEIGERLGIKLLARIPTPPRKLSSHNRLAMLEPENSKSRAEAYRKLRVAMDFANIECKGTTIMITSSVEREGKSTTVANLAVALARDGRRVILVDLDLRRPYIAKFFGLEGRPGTTDVVLGRATLDDALASIVLDPRPDRLTGGNGSRPPDEGRLEVLVAGQLPPDPAEFLGTPTLSDLLATLAARADVVLIDSAPLVPVSDGVALSRHVDAMIVIAHAELLRRPILGEMDRLLHTCDATKLGFVLTGAEAEGGDYGYGYGYGYAPSIAQRPS